MKKWSVVALVVLSVALLTAKAGLAQEPQSEDQKTDVALKQNAELKRQLREEIEKQNKLLQEKLDRLRQENADLAAGSAPAGSANETNKANGTNTSGTDGGGAGADGGAASTNTIGSPTSNSRTAMRARATTTTTTTLSAAPARVLVAAPPVPNVAATQTAASPINGNCLTIFVGTQQPSRLEQAKCFLARAMVQDPANSGVNLTSETESYFLMTLFGQIASSGNVAVNAATKSFVLDSESSRTDKQMGSDPKTSGTTSLAVKGGIPSVLSWAVENGAAVASATGTSYTFRVNPVGFAQALASEGYISGFRKTENDPLSSFLRKSSIGFTFDTTRGTNPPTLIGSKQQLSQVSFRYVFVNGRDPRSKQYQKLWDDFFQKEGVAFSSAQVSQLKALEDSSDPIRPKFKNADLQKWVDDTNAAYKLQAADLRGNGRDVTDKMVAFMDQRLASLPIIQLEQDSTVVNALTGFVTAYQPFLDAKKKILDEVAKGTLATFEYINFREPNAPDLSSFRFIAEKGMLGGLDFTANGSLTLYNKRPTGPKIQRLRDFDFSAQLDKKLVDVMGMGPSTLSFAGKYQRLTSNAVALDGTVLPLTMGDIAAGQIKLTIPIKDTGIKIPFSITFANRTELVREREVRGNFGFTFDLDTLFAKFKSFSQP